MQGRRRLALLAPALALLLAGCAHTLDLQLAPGKPVQVRQGAAVAQLDPGTEPYRQLQAWIGANRDGWHTVTYTPTMTGGTYVRLDGVDLRFLDRLVLADTGRGVFEKERQACDCAFLRAVPALEPAQSPASTHP